MRQSKIYSDMCMINTYHLYVVSKEAELRKREQNGGCQGEGVSEMGKCWSKGKAIRRVSFGDLIYPMVIIMNTTVLLT